MRKVVHSSSDNFRPKSPDYLPCLQAGFKEFEKKGTVSQKKVNCTMES